MSTGTWHQRRGEVWLADAEKMAGRKPELATVLTAIAVARFKAAKNAIAAEAAGLVRYDADGMPLTPWARVLRDVDDQAQEDTP